MKGSKFVIGISCFMLGLAMHRMEGVPGFFGALLLGVGYVLAYIKEEK